MKLMKVTDAIFVNPEHVESAVSTKDANGEPCTRIRMASGEHWLVKLPLEAVLSKFITLSE